MKHRLWHYLTEAADFAAGFLVLAGGFGVIIFGVPIIAEFVLGLN